MADWVSAVMAILAFFVSLFSLFVSWSSANTAKQANDIQMHVHRKELYSAFYDLYIRFRIEGSRIKFGSVFEFQQFSKTSFLYVPDALYKAMDEFYINCRKISEANEAMNWLANYITDHRKAGFTEEELAGSIKANDERRDEIKRLMEVTVPLSIQVHNDLKEEIRLDKVPKGIWQRMKEIYDDPFPWDDKQEPQ